MTDADAVVKGLMDRYAAAVNAGDSKAYAKLFARDAIRVPPGNDPERGPEAIARSEQSDYDEAHWSIKMRLGDALRITDTWVYGLVHVEAALTFKADGRHATKQATKGFLLERQPDGAWLIKRYMWNLKG